jgi:hypothetical protein
MMTLPRSRRNTGPAAAPRLRVTHNPMPLRVD